MSQQQNQSDHTFTGINVTPLTDVMLVLLITFLLTASSFQSQSLSLPLPQVVESKEIEGRVTVLAVDQSGGILWEDSRYSSLSEVEAFRELLASSEHKVLALAVHREATYGNLFPLLQAASDAGWPNVVLLTEDRSEL